MHDKASLVTSIEQYQTSFPEEALLLGAFLELLQHPRAFHRDHLPGHITGSAWILDETKTFALLTHHAKLNRWLQPGGHADGDENIINVALREATEETGLQSLKVARHSIFDLDIHAIPARENFPQHLHYDIRILLHASKKEKPAVTEESHDLQWVPLAQVPQQSGQNISMIRMCRKTVLP